jgi:hypothetical protein
MELVAPSSAGGGELPAVLSEKNHLGAAVMPCKHSFACYERPASNILAVPLFPKMPLTCS